MEWLNTIFTEQTVIQAVIVLSLICALGLTLGKIKIFGVSLGATFVFFVGILAGHLGLRIDPDMLAYAESFGLILFVYALGLQVGPGFFSSLGKHGLKLNLLAMLVIFLGVSLTVVFHLVSGVSLPDMVGILSGAVTNTPALGAAQQTLKQLNEPLYQQTDLALGCAVAYPLGVVGVIIALITIRKMFASRIFYKDTSDDRTKKTLVVALHADRPEIHYKTVKEVAQMCARRFVISRIWRGKRTILPTSDTVIKPGDRLVVITTEGDVDHLIQLIGERENTDWNNETINWETLDRKLTTQRIVITRPEINGKKLGALRLRNLYGINITRIYRAGIVLLPTPDLTLQMGDRLHVVGETDAVVKVGEFLGNAVKNLDEPNLVSVFVGMCLGLLLGSVPFMIPGISFPVKLGFAGGPMIVGILVGAFGPRINMITYTTVSANWMLRALGLSMFLGCLGLDAGANFFATVFRPEGALWIALGFLITFLPLILVGWIAITFLKTDFGSVAGMLCGSMSNPMALNYIHSTISGETPSIAYATVYPLSMFLRVITAQLILILFL